MDNEVLNGTYKLLHRFRYPTQNTTIDAIAVSRHSANILISFYTLMFGVIVSQVWTFIVLLGAAFFMRKSHSHNRAAVTAGIYNAQSSPVSVVLLILKYIKPMRREFRYLLLWTILATLAIAASALASILITPFLQIGIAAPVNRNMVYLPANTMPDGAALNRTMAITAYALNVPGALRAAGLVSTTPRNSISIEQEASNNESFVQVNYHYNISAAEFGLQVLPGLILHVDGSCYTEYSWYRSTVQTNRSTTDTYYLWNDSTYTQNVSSSDGGPPFPYFNPNLDSYGPGVGSSNITYAIAISSLGRLSTTAGTDPWYLTETVNSGASSLPNKVRNQRPVLSCWQSQVLHYKGMESDVWDLYTLDLEFGTSRNSTFLADVFGTYLIRPSIVQVGQHLGRSALESSLSTATGAFFNAAGASINRDLNYLVMASYIATRNMFVETTRYSTEGRAGLLDLARDEHNLTRFGTGEFVITDAGVSTLSIRMIIIVPTVTVGMVLLAFAFSRVPSPWRVSNALNATVLYSHLHQAMADGVGESQDWDREGTVSFSRIEAQAAIIPVWQPAEGGFKWVRSPKWVLLFLFLFSFCVLYKLKCESRD
ncbi:hypothetical protein AOQ84DRAFT_416731 [Glonium stellatum]|uniref:Uncharacterized protein n=1 Tax=Glonium stellatum TaxID=574774 RepID=A0A8E2ETV0_9PEZI|nr:hypothetical protein AOQ84DRAFT_416731 [Glonium stellatum]